MVSGLRVRSENNQNILSIYPGSADLTTGLFSHPTNEVVNIFTLCKGGQ